MSDQPAPRQHWSGCLCDECYPHRKKPADRPAPELSAEPKPAKGGEKG